MTSSIWYRLTLPAAVAFGAFSAGHLIDEFVWGAPAEFHLSVEAAEGLALVYMLALLGLTVAAARGSRTGLAGLATAGFLIALADVLKHAPEMVQPGPWRSGLVSEGLALGLTLSALLTGVTAIAALRDPRPQTES